MYPYSLICHSLPHPPASLRPSLTHSLTLLPHSFTPLPDSLSVSLIRSRSLFCYSLPDSFTPMHHSVSLTPLPHSFSHSLPCLTDCASLTPSLPCSLPWLTHILPVSFPHSLIASPTPLPHSLPDSLHILIHFPVSVTP